MNVISRVVAGAIIALALAAGPTDAAYNGSGGVWAQKKGAFIPTNFAGDDAGIKAAIAYADGGGIVQLQAGAYSITSTIIVDKPGLRIMGVGDSTIFINSSSPGDTIFAVHADGVTLSDFRINGLKGSGRTVGNGVWINGRSNVTVERLTIADMPDAAVHVHMGSSRCAVRNCRIISPGASGVTTAHGIIVHQSTDCEVSGNYIFGTLRNGVWSQGSTKRLRIENNSIDMAGKDGIEIDSTALHVDIGGNLITSPAFAGITADGDSSNVWGNSVSGASTFGLWSEAGGRGSSWVGNIFKNCGNYSMSIEQANGRTIEGWLIASNFSLNPNGIGLEIQSNLNGAVRNVQVVGNYFIGSGANKPIVRMTPVNGTIERVSIMNNVIKESVNHGIEADVVGGVATIHDLVITGNHLIDNFGRGIAFRGISTGGTAYISDNFATGNGASTGGTDEDSIGTGWSIEELGKGTSRFSTIIAEDSLRVGDAASGESAPIVSTGSITAGTDLVFKGNIAQGAKAGSLLTPDSDDNGNIQFRSNASYQAGLVFRDTTGTAAGGAGTKHKAMWLEASRDLYIMPFPTTRYISFRSPADTSEVLRITGSGTTLTGSSSVTGPATQSGDRTLIVDSLRVGLTTRSSPATITGPLTTYSKASILDSLRVIGNLAIGRKEGIPPTLTVGVGGIVAADTANVILNSTTGSSLHTPSIIFARNGTQTMRFATNGTNNVWRISDDGSKFFRFGTLASDAAGFVATIDNTGRMELGTGVPGYKLEVNGDAYIADSLRAVGGIKVGSATAINIKKVYAAAASLDFDLTSVPCQDLTMTVTGAAVGDPVFISTPTQVVDGSVTGEGDNQAVGWVSAADTVTIRVCRHGTAHNPDAGVFVATVFHY